MLNNTASREVIKYLEVLKICLKRISDGCRTIIVLILQSGNQMIDKWIKDKNHTSG